MQETERGELGAGENFVNSALKWPSARCLPLLAAALVLGASAPAWAQTDGSAEEPGTAPAPEPAAPAAEPEAAPPPAGPHTANAIQLGVGFRYGIAMGSDSDLNPWGTGLGLNVGYTLPNAIYLGGNFEYFFGGTADVGSFRLKSNIWQLSAEGGYDIGLGENFVIRPKVGVGVAGSKASIEGCLPGISCGDQGNTTSDTSPLVAPGATFMLFTSHISLALDVRYALVFGDSTAKALILSFGIGL